MGRLELILRVAAASAFEYTTMANYVGTLKDLKFCARLEGFIGNIGRVKKADASVTTATGLDGFARPVKKLDAKKFTVTHAKVWAITVENDGALPPTIGGGKEFDKNPSARCVVCHEF